MADPRRFAEAMAATIKPPNAILHPRLPVSGLGNRRAMERV
jgi:hypothetical protein